MKCDVHQIVREIIASDCSIADKKELMNEVRKLLPPDENRWNFRFVIWTLALVALSAPAMVFVNMFTRGGGAEIIPEGLLALSSTAVGAVAAYLTPQLRRRQESNNNSAETETNTEQRKIENI